MCDMIIAGKKPKEIFPVLGLKYDQSSISYYERMRRELRADRKI